MMRKQYTAAFKARVVQELLKEEKTLAQIAAEYEVHPTQHKTWRATALEGLPGLWWSQKSRQFLVETKTKHNHSRKPVLSARIDLRWRLIVQRLMKPLLIVKREVRSQIAHGFGNALVIFDVHLLIFHTAP